MQKSSKRSCTSTSWTTASEWTDAAKDTLPTPTPPYSKEYNIVHKDYDLPIHYRKAILDDYERDNNNVDGNNKKRQQIHAKDTPHTSAPSVGKEDDIAQRDYDLPIPYRKEIPDNYEHNNGNDKKNDKVEVGDILVVEAG